MKFHFACIIIYRCVPFPHSHLLCGQYIDASTMVYIDPNAFNYTEANSKIIKLEDGLAFSLGEVNSCRWILIYTACLSIYPHCNTDTQKLMSPCIDDCLEYTNRSCRDNFIILATAIMFPDDPLVELFLLNCSAPFRAFGSVNIDIDTENCYNFNCKLVYNIQYFAFDLLLQY